MGKVLLNIITDRLSHLENKGEMTSRYYNPGGEFDEVHILMTNEDSPTPEKLQKMAGDARLYIHNLPASKKLLITSLFWRPALLKGWAAGGVELAKKIKPDVIRCYGNYINGFIASEIKKELGIPYIVSLHTHPDENRSNLSFGWKNFLYYHFTASVENVTLKNADYVVGVYKSLIPYVNRRNPKNYETIYNTVTPDKIRIKSDYTADTALKILSVGRLIPGKNPEYLIDAAIAEGAHLTVVGNGPLRPALMDRAEQAQGPGKVTFIQSISNEKLCEMSPDFDVFAIHSDYDGIPKTVLEASLCGLPVVVNKRMENQVPEFEDGWMELVNNSFEGYSMAIKRLANMDYREDLGKKALKYSHKHWNPQQTELRYAELYKQIMQNRSA
ncbi:glycosyltransferase [Maridesulfovibrio sp.]|uniref:glycosyltransferase n=1 Tax=Maridesulfovibrio sp. TaxID=2795000 RepID=UPI002A188AE1|nr:glycosyltransferase [Maridesulfovibrio sp.]